MRVAGWAGWFVAAALLMSTSCAAVGPPKVTPAALLAERDAYDGKTVTTEGTVIELIADSGADPSYAVRDDSDNTVRLVPSGWAVPYQNQRASVTGLFRLAGDGGAELVIHRIHPPP